MLVLGNVHASDKQLFVKDAPDHLKRTIYKGRAHDNYPYFKAGYSAFCEYQLNCFVHSKRDAENVVQLFNAVCKKTRIVKIDFSNAVFKEPTITGVLVFEGVSESLIVFGQLYTFAPLLVETFNVQPSTVSYPFYCGNAFSFHQGAMTQEVWYEKIHSIKNFFVHEGVNWFRRA